MTEPEKELITDEELDELDVVLMERGSVGPTPAQDAWLAGGVALRLIAEVRRLRARRGSKERHER